MSTRYARILLAGLAGAVTAVLGVTATLAVTTWTVRPGGAVTAKFASVTLRDADTGTIVRCPSTVRAVLKRGTGLPGADIGNVSSWTLGPCAGAADSRYTLKLSLLPATLNASSYKPGTGTTTAEINGINGTVVGTRCSFMVDGTGAEEHNGTIVVTYANGTGTLKFLPTGGNLHVYNLHYGCRGLFGTGHDRLTLSGTGTMTPSQTITSP